MNAYKLEDYSGNVYMVESEVSVDDFNKLAHDFCCEKYDEYKDCRDKDAHFEALDKFIDMLSEKGFKSRLIKPVESIHFWVWE